MMNYTSFDVCCDIFLVKLPYILIPILRHDHRFSSIHFLDLGTPTRTLIALLPSKAERGETTWHERKQIPARLLWYH